MKLLKGILVVGFCIAAIAPIAWHLLTSIKPPAELSLIPPTLLPRNPTLLNYTQLFQVRPFLRYYLNSFTIAAMSSLICIGTASLAAYRLARVWGRTRSAIRAALLAVAFFPPIVFLFPVYELVRKAGLVNHPWGLIVPYAALNLPFAI